MVSNLQTQGDANRSVELSDGDHTDAEPVVSVRNLTKVYGNDVRALDDVSFDIERGTVVGLLGPNGAGKTTCIKSVLGLIAPTAGSICVSGIDVTAERTRSYQHVGAVLEGARNIYWRLTVRENLEFFASLAGHRPSEMRERHDDLLDQFGLREKADEQVNDLSRGMKQRAMLACTLSRNVDVAVLDEPTLGLDVESSVELQRKLRRLADHDSMTLILSSHDMDIVERICDRVLILGKGRIIADATVDNLTEFFRTQTYHVTVEGTLTESVRVQLTDEFDATDWQSIDDRTRFTAPLTGGAELRELLDRVLSADYEVTAVDTTTPDFEEIFLTLIENDTTGISTTCESEEVSR